LASDLSLGSNWWGFSSAFAQDKLIYVSHQESDYLPDVPSPFGGTTTVDPSTGKTNTTPMGVWVQRYFLDVVDYSDAQNPTVRKPVNIPGTLNGLSHNGDVLYTIGYHWGTNWTSDYTQWLDACAYDGVSAALVDSMAIPNTWPNANLIQNGNIFIARPDTTTNAQNRLETWKLNEKGRFAQMGLLIQPDPSSVLNGFGNLLVAQNSDGSIKLLNATDPFHLKVLGQHRMPGWLWPSLNRAIGGLNQGLWIPLDDYGVEEVEIPTASP
jgi:hypothetical protein